jgi:ubiquinone/menaquinone biosynthesis C-methylase UbiE
VINIARKVARKIIPRAELEPPFEKPDPKEYSTLTTPMEVPVQREAYYLALKEYVSEGDKVLDVGMGLGYGLTIMSIKAKEVAGVDVDKKSVDYCNDSLFGRNPKLKKILHYDGYHLPFKDNEYDVIVSIDVLEHVERYDEFLKELARVAKKAVVINTPNRRPENTNSDGTPKNYWHLREWSSDELKTILRNNGFRFDFFYINGPADGPYKVSVKGGVNIQSLTPVILLEGKKRK